MDSNKKIETQEEFCTACAVVPLAFAGAGASAYGASSKGSNKKMKKILLWSGVATVLISLLIVIYIYFIRKGDCKDCR